jgi:hypothetical protein
MLVPKITSRASNAFTKAFPMKNWLRTAVTLVFLAVLSVCLGGDTVAATRPIAYVPTGTGFFRTVAGVETTTGQKVPLGDTTYVSGTLAVGNGGTGAASLASGEILLGNGSGAITSTATLGVSKGGTGAATFSTNNVLLGNGASSFQTVAPGTSGNVLTSNGTTWSSSASASGNLYGTYASRPAAGVAGRVYYASDCPNPFVDNGAAWQPVVNGKLGTAAPLVSTFTQVTGGSVTGTVFADVCDGISITWTNLSAGGEFVRMLYKAKPASGASGYRITTHVRFFLPSDTSGSLLAGLGWRLASNGSIALVDMTNSLSSVTGNFHEIRYTANNTGSTPTYTFSNQTSSANTAIAFNAGQWFRSEHNTVNGNRTAYWSSDGVTWSENIAQRLAANTFITPDQVVVHCWQSNTNTGTTPINRGCLFDSYEISTF